MERVRQLLQSSEPVKWLFEGDSITHGALHTFGERDYTELFTERIRFERGRRRDVVIKTACSGNTTRELLADFDWRVRQFQPQVVFIMIGMNDCSAGRNLPREEFRDNLRDLCQRGAALPALPVLQTTCPILPGTAPDRETSFDAYMDTVREVARTENTPLVDHTGHWRAYFQHNPGAHDYWMSNAFHPNQYGHRAFAELLFRELDLFDPNAATCRLFHP